LNMDDDQTTKDTSSIEDSLRHAEELKGEGNDHYRARRWEDALAVYRTGLGRLPKRKPKPRPSQNSPEHEVSVGDEPSDSENTKEQEEQEPLTEEQVQIAKVRAVLNANIAACYIKLREWKEAANACSEALLDDPDYTKALQRRATSNVELSTWSSLTSAQEDYNKLLTILPESSDEVKEIHRTLRVLKPRLEEAQKQETAEMIDKLKGMGNSILGNFGLSTDNFKFVPNGQGGYSMNFNR